MTDPAPRVTPAVDADALARGRASGEPALARWAAARQARDATDLAEALAAAQAADHVARDRALERIAESGATDCASAVRALAEAPDACGAPIRTLLALRDPAAVAIAGRWLARRSGGEVEDVATVVAALLAEGSGEALAEARRVRDARLLDRHAPLLLAFHLLAVTGAREDADAAVTAWLQAPPSRWRGEEAAAAFLAECGLAVVPGTWFHASRRVPEFLRGLADSTDAALERVLPGEARKDFARHWQKRHWQEVLARLGAATDDARLPPALQALVAAIRARSDVLARLDPDDAGDLLAILLGAALVSHADVLDTAAMAPQAVAAEMARPVRRVDPRAIRALLDRCAALGEAMLGPLEQLVVDHAGDPQAGLAVAALLRGPHPARLRALSLAAGTPLPSTLLGRVLEALTQAGQAALPLLREALADPAHAPSVPTPALLALIEGAAYAETAALVAPVLPRWLARAKRAALGVCAALAHRDLLPALVDDWVEGEHDVGDVIRLIATVQGDAALAATHPPREPERPGLLRGPDGRPVAPPLRLLLRCLDCGHGYPYAVRQVQVRNASVRFVEQDDGPPGPPDGLAIPDAVTCKRCGAVDRYRFTGEAIEAVRNAMQAEVLRAMEAEYLAKQRAAAAAAPRKAAEPPRLSPGGIILP